MLYIIIPFAIWILIGIFLSVREKNELIFPIFILTSVPLYLTAMVVLGALGFNAPRNPSVKVNEVTLTSLRDNIYVGNFKNNNFYIYATEDGAVHALECFDGIDVYIKQTTENFRMEHWMSHVSIDAFPGRAYYVFYIPENGVCVIN